MKLQYLKKIEPEYPKFINSLVNTLNYKINDGYILSMNLTYTK